MYTDDRTILPKIGFIGIINQKTGVTIVNKEKKKFYSTRKKQNKNSIFSTINSCDPLHDNL